MRAPWSFNSSALLTEFRGNGKVEEVVFTTSAGEEKVIKCGLVITAIGYEPEPLAGIPYEKGKVLNNRWPRLVKISM
jgi:thioredoxin reductase